MYKTFSKVPGERSLKEIMFGVVAVAIGIGIHRAANWLKEQVKKNEQLKAQYQNEPWMQRQDWAKGYSIPNENSRQKINFYVGLILFLVTSGGSALAVKKIVDHQAPILLLAIFIFPLVGLLMIREALREFFIRKKFGETQFSFAGTGGVLGGTLKGQIRLERGTFKEAALLTLQCKSVTIERSANNANDRKYTTARVLWQKKDKQFITSEGSVSVLPIDLSIPFDVEATDESDVSNRKIWELVVEFKNGETSFKKTYEIPVFKTNESDSAKIQATDVKEVLSEFKDKKSTSFLIAETGEGLQLSFSKKQIRKGSILLIFVGSVFLGGGLFKANTVLHAKVTSQSAVGLVFDVIFEYGFPGLFALVFSSVGFLILLMGLYSNFEKVQVLLGKEQMTIKRRFGPFKFGKTLSYRDIRSVSLKAAATMGDTVWYDIALDAGTKLPLGIPAALLDKNEALWVLGQIESRKAALVNAS